MRASALWTVILATQLAGCGYNKFQTQDEQVKAAWSEVVNQYQRRADLIPNLVNTVKGYAAHEQQTFAAVTAQRADAMATTREPDEQGPREHALGQGVAQLMAVAERYPELKASEQFLALQKQLADTEDRIQVARRIYNANVRAYDTLIQSFPAMLMARSFDFTLRPYFEVEAAVREAGPPSVDLSGQT
jgi:LemA protein